MRVDLVPCGQPVNESERKAFAELKTRLISELGNERWVLLTNLAFSATRHRQSDEIDIVAIGPPGVQVIEVKHWTAAWCDRNPEVVKREAERVTEKARRIGTTLRRQVDSLRRVDGVFLVTEAAVKVRALEGRDVRGVRFHTFRNWRDAVGLDARRVLSEEQARTCARALEPRSAAVLDGTLKRFAGYARLDLQTPPNQRFHRVYKATHTSRQDRVVLHLYDLSADDDARAADKAEREWKSLQRLQQHGWAPRIVDSFQDAPGYPGEIKFFTEADPAAPGIGERSGDDTWDAPARAHFARGAVQALIDLHGSGVDREPMLHRNLTPGTILVRHDNSPILTGFEHARIPADVSVASPVAAKDWNAAVSPEIRAQGLGAADCRSDVYSLCASLAVLFKGREDATSVRAAELLASGTDHDPRKRPGLSDLEASLSTLVGDPAPEPPAPPARFWTEDQLVPFGANRYRIVARLGSGGVGTAFKVVEVDHETQDELGTYVAKVARDEETGQRVLGAYRLARSHLRHSALSTIFEVAPEWRENGFLALMAWIDGHPLGEYAGILPLLAEELQEASDESLALTWLREACEALRVLHDNGLVHGDVSPRNMIVSGNGLVLTDYDCVTRIGVRADAPGTVLYCSPSCLEGRAAAPSDDLYALAASFFHVLFEREPFQYGGVRAKERGLNWSGIEAGRYPMLGGFLGRATNPDPDERFPSVEDALAELRPRVPAEGRSVDGGGTALPDREKDGTAERSENKVEWLRSLLQSYPGSRWGNRETRGLDTEFAEKTYVETRLEQALHRAIVERRVKLVVLCGNAGDGKTALLQHLAKRLGLEARTSATRILEGRLDDGMTVRMNLDGSASWQGRSADDLLDEFLAPFQDGPPDEDIAHLLAINDGRLLEWIERQGDDTSLKEHLYNHFVNGTAPAESHIRLVDLNQRSLVGGVTADGKSIDTGFLGRLVDSLYGGERAAEIWAPCRTCSAQERCEVFRATGRFGPTGFTEDPIRDHARGRLFEALQAVHLRGETHITVRELRAALVYILFGVHYCSDYHRASDDGIGRPRPYWDRAFSPESAARQGQVLGELPRFDPALEANPQLDRHLLPSPQGDGVVGLPPSDGKGDLGPLRRRAYFEWSQECIASVTGDPDALGLAHGRHLRQFRDLAIDQEDNGRNDLVQRLCNGISRLEALPLKVLDREGVVPLRITPRTPTETAFWTEKPIGSFRLKADLADGGEGVDRLHRQASLIYRYRDGREETLRLGADLFHLLLELGDGYQLGDAAADDTFAHLSIFVQRMVREDHRQLFAWNPMSEDTTFKVSVRIVNAGSSARQRLVITPLEASERSHGD